MEHITFEIDNSKDLKLLITIAEKLGIKKFFYTHELKAKPTELNKLLKIIDKGVDISNFGSISEWQRNTRTDRNINLSILIYAASDKHKSLRDLLKNPESCCSIISQLEVLGYPIRRGGSHQNRQNFLKRCFN